MRLEDVAATLAARYAESGEPLQAAMCFLAVSEAPRAVATLLRAHEVVLAYVVAELLGQAKDPAILRLMAECAARDGRWHVAADVWRQNPELAATQLPLLAARIPDTATAFSISPVELEHYHSVLQSSLASGDKNAAVFAAVCAGDRRNAVELGVAALHELFARGGWTVDQARLVLDPLQALPVHNLDVTEIAGILSCAAYVGLVEASSLGYEDLMFPLAQTLKNIITHQSLHFPVSFHDISLLESAGCAKRNPAYAAQVLSGILDSPDAPAHVRALCEQQLAALRQPPINALPAADGDGLESLLAVTCHHVTNALRRRQFSRTN